MKKILFLTFILLLIVPLASAEQIYSLDETIDLKISCTNNETYCTTNAGCNLTIILPNNSLLIDNKPMTQNLAYFNYTLNGTIINEVGDYQNYVFCMDGGFKAFEDFIFKITKSGNESTSSQGMIFIGIIVAIFALAFLLVQLSNHFDNTLKFAFIGFALFVMFSVFPLAIHFMDSSGGSGTFTSQINNVVVTVYSSYTYFLIFIVTITVLLFIKYVLDELASYGKKNKKKC